jgi:heme/copper-type cytochrome/quinol oxidase subunit 2
MSILKKFHKIINNGIIFLVMVPLLILVFVFKSPFAKKNKKRKNGKNKMDIVRVIQEIILFLSISLSLYVYLRKLAFVRDDHLLKTLAFHMMLLTLFMKSMKLIEILLVTYVKFIPTHFILIILNSASFLMVLSLLFNVERKIDSALIYLIVVYTLLIYLIVLTANILTALFIFSNRNENIISGEKYGEKKLETYKLGLKEVIYENQTKRHLTADTLTLSTINILYFSFIFMIKFTGLSTILANKFYN